MLKRSLQIESAAKSDDFFALLWVAKTKSPLHLHRVRQHSDHCTSINSSNCAPFFEERKAIVDFPPGRRFRQGFD